MLFQAPQVHWCPSAGPNAAAVRFRIALDKSESADNRFRWKSGAKPCLYGLLNLETARKAGHVTIVEGESDCHTLWHHGIPAVGVPVRQTGRRIATLATSTASRPSMSSPNLTRENAPS